MKSSPTAITGFHDFPLCFLSIIADVLIVPHHTLSCKILYRATVSFTRFNLFVSGTASITRISTVSGVFIATGGASISCSSTVSTIFAASPSIAAAASKSKHRHTDRTEACRLEKGTARINFTHKTSSLFLLEQPLFILILPPQLSILPEKFSALHDFLRKKLLHITKISYIFNQTICFYTLF